MYQRLGVGYQAGMVDTRESSGHPTSAGEDTDGTFGGVIQQYKRSPAKPLRANTPFRVYS